MIAGVQHGLIINYTEKIRRIIFHAILLYYSDNTRAHGDAIYDYMRVQHVDLARLLCYLEQCEVLI